MVYILILIPLLTHSRIYARTGFNTLQSLILTKMYHFLPPRTSTHSHPSPFSSPLPNLESLHARSGCRRPESRDECLLSFVTITSSAEREKQGIALQSRSVEIAPAKIHPEKECIFNQVVVYLYYNI